MTDPVTALGIAGVVATLVRTLGGTIQNLHQLQQRYHAATETLRNIVWECEMLEISVKHIQIWIDSLEEYPSNARNTQGNAANPANLEGLSRSLSDFLPKLQAMDGEVTRLLSGVAPGGRLGMGARARYMWNEETMARYRDEIRWNASALHLLLTAMNLSFQGRQRQRQSQRARDTPNPSRTPETQTSANGNVHDRPDDPPPYTSPQPEPLRPSPPSPDPKPFESPGSAPSTPHSMPAASAAPDAQDGATSTSSLVRALYTYKSTVAGNLSFRKGQIIVVIERSQRKWWTGCLDGDSGLFPSNYVEVLQPDKLPSPTGTAKPAKQGSGKGFELTLSEAEKALLTDTEAFTLLGIASGQLPINQCVGPDQLTVIHIAAKAGSVQALGQILKHPRFQSRVIPPARVLDKDNLDANGRSAIHYAAQSGNAGTLELLLPAEQSTSQKAAGHWDNDGVTPLHLAARFGQCEITKALLNVFGPLAPKKLALTTKSQHYTPFLEAVAGGHHAVCQILLRYGAKPGARSMSNETALHIAARAGQHEMIPMLISNKIPIDWIDHFGESAVRIAAEKGSVSTIEALIEAGAKRNRKNNLGKTALHLAAEGNHRAVVEYLLRKGATKNVTTRSGETAAELACGAQKVNAVDVVRLLGISTPKEGVRCLFAAIKAYNLDSVRYLLSSLGVDPNGVDPQNADKKQATALHLASARGNAAIVGVVLAYGGSIYARDAAQNTPLHYAVAAGMVDAAKRLLKAGADPDYTNKDGKSAKSLARTMPQAEALLEVLV